MNSIKKTNYQNQIHTDWLAYKMEEWDEHYYEEHGDEYMIDFKEDFFRQVYADFNGPFDVEFFQSLYEEPDAESNEEICRRGICRLAKELII